MSKDGLKPIGEIVKDALSGLGGPVQALRDDSPLSVTMVYPPPGRLIYQGNSPTLSPG